MSAPKWEFVKGFDEGEANRSRKIAKKMLLDGKPMNEIMRYSDLPDEDLAGVLRELPQEIQAKYTILRG